LVTPCDFSLGHYRQVLQEAKGRGYQFRLCREFASAPVTDGQVLVLRHDVDCSLDWSRQVAALEYEEGVRSTVFIRVDAKFYDASSPANRRVLRWLVEHGFEIGLHYTLPAESTGLAADVESVCRNKARLEDLAGCSIDGLAEHMPRRRGRDVVAGQEAIIERLLRDGAFRYDAYSPLFLSGLTYLSDTNQNWRRGCVHTWLGREPKLYVLTHPVWWFVRSAERRDAIIQSLREGW